MKLLCLVLLSLVPFMSKDTGDSIDRTAELLRTSNIEELCKSFAPTVDLTIMGEENIYPAAEAKNILVNFFKQKQPHSVKVLHKITSNTQYHYGVILLKTSNGEYRVAVALKNINGSFELTEMRIEAEKMK